MIPSPRTPADTEPDWAHTAALAELAVAGDRDAFGELYQLHFDVVFRFASARVFGRQNAEDIAAEAFLRALRNIETFTWVRGGFIGWMITITRNLIMDLYKSSRYRHEVTTADMLDVGIEPGPEDVILARITSAEIHAAISDLNLHQRTCIEGRFLDQLSVRETAERIGITENATKTLQYRAVRTLSRDPRLTPETVA